MKYLAISWGRFGIAPKLLNKVFEFMAGVNVEFFARMLEMVLHRSHADVQFAGNLIIAPILGSESRDFLFAN